MYNIPILTATMVIEDIPKNAMSEPQQRWRPQFRLRYLLIGVAVVSGLLAIYINVVPRRYEARAYIDVNSGGKGPAGELISDAFDRRQSDLERGRAMQLVLRQLKGKAVLMSTLARQEIESLSLVNAQDDRLAYLSDHLSVSKYDRDTIEVTFADRTNDSRQLATIVDELIEVGLNHCLREQRNDLFVETMERHEDIRSQSELLKELAEQVRDAETEGERLNLERKLAEEQEKYKTLRRRRVVLEFQDIDLQGPRVLQPAAVRKCEDTWLW
ncbi:hypothetical protein OAS39_01740 [Pirellulales bacterium]|nr:hypothetical protein [Pirellulales bacterium]